MKLKYDGKKDHKVIKFGKQHLRLAKGETSPELSEGDIAWNMARHDGLEIIGEPKKEEKPKTKNMPKKGKDKKAKKVEEELIVEKKDDGISFDMEAQLAASVLEK